MFSSSFSSSSSFPSLLLVSSIVECTAHCFHTYVYLLHPRCSLCTRPGGPLLLVHLVECSSSNSSSSSTDGLAAIDELIPSAARWSSREEGHHVKRSRLYPPKSFNIPVLLSFLIQFHHQAVYTTHLAPPLLRTRDPLSLPSLFYHHIFFFSLCLAYACISSPARLYLLQIQLPSQLTSLHNCTFFSGLSGAI